MNNNCTTGKRSFDNKSLAEEALIQHHIRNSYKTGEGPINVYECDDCGNWHFTSKGIKNELFSDAEIVKKIQSERIGYQWERKIR